MKQVTSLLFITGILTMFTACSSNPPMKTVDYVDINRFMGKWYVIANIPTFIEKKAHNAVEQYQLNPDGSIATTFTFRKGGFDGELKKYEPVGFIKNTTTNALWGMQFIWPIKADYRIVYLDEDYSRTIIGRQSRDYVWLMARTPEIPEKEYEQLVNVIANLGYDAASIQPVPQNWSGEVSR